VAEAIKYRAFLSYSHADTATAKRVHGRLEGFHIDKDLVGRDTPTGQIPGTLQPIFRDRYEFDAGGLLVEQTSTALDSSAALIVLASPHAARSKYVNEELRQFKSRHPERPVIPVIVDGEPADPERECFPPALRFAVASDGSVTNTPVDVLAADLREQGDGIELALAKVVARLIGLSPDEVYRRADRERRRQRRQERRVQAIIYVLLIGIIAGLVGWIEQSYIAAEWRWWTVTRPFMVSQVRPHVLTAAQEQALKLGDSFKECATDCPEMIVVPAGSFTMGSPPTEKGRDSSEEPQHEVTITKPFAVSKFELTFDEWDTCVTYGDCPQGVSDSTWGRGSQPVINVTWEDAQRYVAWLSKMADKPYRLLTEAEYEYVVRGGTQTAYPWGDDIGKNNANCNGCGSKWDNSQTAPAASFAANGFGLYDIVGNVFEWLEDCLHDNYNGAPTEGSAWIQGGKCKSRIVRGGSWVDAPELLRSANRNWVATDFRSNFLGFRVARALLAP
jgi:formylglycine-generating enzyme required for sulfatase activity